MTSLNDIKKTSVLPPKVLNQLLQVENIKSTKSIACPHLPAMVNQRLPLWTVDYWVAIRDIQAKKVQWAKVEDFLELYKQEKLLKEAQNLVAEVYGMLGSLPWSVKIKGFQASIESHFLA